MNLNYFFFRASLMEQNIKKILVLVFLQVLFSGCPAYDPPTKFGGVNIENTSDTPVYVLISCGDSISKYYALSKYELYSPNCTGEHGNPKTDTIFPNYRVQAHNKQFVIFEQSGKMKITGCSDSTLRIFFIPEQIMREKSWNEIAAKQLYAKKIVLTQKGLDNCGWTVRF